MLFLWFPIYLRFFFVTFFVYSEKADLKSRSDSTNGPQLDSIYTTPAGFHHHHTAGTQGSPEAMKVRMAAMVLQPPTRV